MIATHPAERIEDAIADVLPRLRGAFSIVVMTKDRVLAFRDPTVCARSHSACSVAAR